MEFLTANEASVVNIDRTQDWYAWINLMPPPPNDFHVVGQVLVSNPGVTAILTPKEPQGINPTILLLDLILVQQPGYWPQVMTWMETRYDRVVKGNPFVTVQIFSEAEAISEVPVEAVQ